MTQSEDAAESIDLAIAAAVTALRQRDSLTVDQLAVYAGINRASLYRKLKGEVGWKATDIAALSSYFGVQPNDLFPAARAVATSRARTVSTHRFAGSRRFYRNRPRRTQVTVRHLAVA